MGACHSYILSLALATAAHGGGILYVDDDAAPAGDGAGWATAYRFLQDALIGATPGTEIRVAQGTYKPDLDDAGNVTPLDRLATFQLVDGVILAGGYAGQGAANPDDRDSALYETFLSGDLAGNDGPGPFDNNQENAYHVVTGSGVNVTASIDGFTITAGNANGPGGPPEYHGAGAGMSNVIGSPTVSDCVFDGNAAGGGGGGMGNFDAASPTITDCAFLGNTVVNAGGVGGGMMNRNGSSPVIGGCVFEGNSAELGGGMHNALSSHPWVTDCEFTGNTADVGGGMRNTTLSCPVVSGCTFSSNSAVLGGGGIFNVLGSNPQISACTFIGNTAGNSGGGIRNFDDASPTIVGCRFEGNTVGTNGGGVHSQKGCSPLVVDCVFIDNFAGHVGGAFGVRQDCHPQLFNCLFVGNEAEDGAGAFRSGNTGSSPIVVNCTFVGNSSPIGGAYSAGSDTPGTVGHSTLVNCVFRDNVAPVGPQIALNGIHPADITVSYSNVEGGEADIFVQTGFTLTWGPGNIDLDAVFVDSDGPDDDPLTWADNDYRLAGGSPCIDAGDNAAVPAMITADLDGNPRFVEDELTADSGLGACPIVDMGAYELQEGLTNCCPADITDDGVVNVLDLIDLLLCFGQPAVPGCEAEDVNGDGTVNVLDLIELLLAFGTSCS